MVENQILYLPHISINMPTHMHANEQIKAKDGTIFLNFDLNLINMKICGKQMIL